MATHRRLEHYFGGQISEAEGGNHRECKISPLALTSISAWRYWVSRCLLLAWQLLKESGTCSAGTDENALEELLETTTSKKTLTEGWGEVTSSVLPVPQSASTQHHSAPQHHAGFQLLQITLGRNHEFDNFHPRGRKHYFFTPDSWELSI